MKSFSIKLSALSLTISLSITCTSCNTVNGLGKDLQNVGNSLEKTSKFRLGASKTATQNVPGYTEDPYLLPTQ